MKKVIHLFFLLLFIIPQITYATPQNSLRVHFIDVGQGDSILIETPDNQAILIDGGVPKAGSKIVRYLKEQQIEEIDLMVATHPDYDHIGGLIAVLEHLPVRKVLENGEVHLTKTFAKYRFYLFKEKIPVQIAQANDSITLAEEVELKVLHAAEEDAENRNQSAIALKLTYEKIDFLFMSDVEAEQEEAIAEKYDVDAEVLKIAHHGSNSSSTLKFLREVRPEVSIITYSASNDYGHPVGRVINNLQKVDSQIFSTAGYGNVVVETNGEQYIVLPEMQPMERLMKRIKNKE
ncbi:ComEC/Rec2 family competence protein [Oceanobacillus alkalisoli]|uniref:ComEC/Rec2 family competence protein n=1 Tax=Oceanobacillus alkalisoli TaxID=2925113 RepID=UPI001EE4CE95|nr:MBL fold metallo-hydrolase [Oceanobacillus alkalisoli]MCG5104979.1 MBL fold metallo-hydrolase [Oceanobacillus alkalisoli]